MLSHLQSVWSFRHFWMALVKMDLRTKYKRSVLGLGWSVLNPIMMSVVLMFGFGWILARGRPLEEYGAYLLTGLCVWEFMRNSLSMGCHALTQNESYIRQSPLPYSIYPLRTVAGTGIHFLITITVTVVMSCLLQKSTFPLQNVWMLPPTIAMLFVFCWGLAAIFSFANAYFHDTQHITDVFMQMMFFLTPIMIMPGPDSPLLAFNQYNPFYVFMRLVRHPLFYNTAPPPELWLQGAGLTALTFAAACCVLGTLQKKVIFQL